ncbi:hypothetical protein Chor_002026 [Crotalus horridus]
MMENEIFASFLFFATLLILKMYATAILTGQVRLRKKAEEVHRNDMETIYPFLFIGTVYSFLHPNPVVARIHFLVFFLGRMVHTVAYLLQMRPPIRSVAYSVAQIPCFSMALQILISVIRHQ